MGHPYQFDIPDNENGILFATPESLTYRIA